MDRFTAMAAFVKVVETGSFARAAERLDVSVSSVSRHVADLETHLNARLLQRTTRRLSLTEAGRAFHERCVQLMADLEEAEASAGAGAVVPRGTLRISCGVSFGVRHMAPAIAAFMVKYPEMRFDFELSDRVVDLVEEGFDAAVRIGAIGSQNLVGRRVGTTQARLLRRSGLPRTVRRAEDARGPRAPCLPPLPVRAATRHVDVRRPQRGGAQGARGGAAATRTTAPFSRRWRRRASASSTSPTSSSGPAFDPAAWCRS